VHDPYAWPLDFEALIFVPALALGYAFLVRRHRTERWRVTCFVAGLALILAVFVTPLHPIALHYLLSIHLLQNVVLAEWAPLLFALSTPPALAATAPRVPPLAALALWVVNYGFWHMPWLYDTALRHPHPLLHLEHALYFATGVLLWWPVVHSRLSSGAKAAYVFAAFALASPIGLVMALVPEPLYDFYVQGPGLWGLSPLGDQQIAGVTMSLTETVVFFAVFAVYFGRFFAEQDAVT